MEVEPEPEHSSFSQTGSFGGIEATPRRVNDRIVLALKPLNTHSDAQISPDITRTALPVDAVEEPIILTAPDGTEYPGSYRPSRSSDASDWDFGNLPAGEYTLRIPYLYFTSTQDTRLSVPLPQASGESLPDTLEAQASFDSVISLKSVTGLGQMTEFPMVGMDENGNPIVIDPDTGLPVTPGDGTTGPGTSGTTDPGTGDETTDPGTGTTDPDTGGETTDPGTGTTDPGTDGGTTDPGTGTADPGTGVSDPGTGTSTPGTGGETADSGTGTDSQPSAGDGGGDSASAAPDDGFVIVS